MVYVRKQCMKTMLSAQNVKMDSQQQYRQEFLFPEEKDGGQLSLINKFIIVFPTKKANRMTFTRFSWYSITANIAQRS